MADILLTVGVDTSLSYAEFQAGITSLVAQVNANPPKIKLKFDDSSLSSMRKQIESMTKAAASAGSLTKLNGYTQTNSGIWLKDTAAIKANTQAKTSNANASRQAADAAKAQATAISGSLKEIQATNANITSAYKNLQKTLGGSTATGQNASDLNAMKSKYIELQEAVTRLKSLKSSATQEDINNVYKLQADMQNLISKTQQRVAVEKQAADAAKKMAEAEKQAAANEAAFAAGTEKHTQALTKVNTLLGQVTANTQKWTAARNGNTSASYASLKDQITALESLKTGLMNGSVSAEQFKERFASIKAAVTDSSTAIRAAGENTQSFGDRISGLAAKFSSWLTVSQAIMYAVRTAKQMVSAAVEVESAMNQIQIVTGASDSQMESFLTRSIALAKELGQSVTDVASSIETFARLGYGMNESAGLAKYANIMANVGNTDVDTATTGITSIIKGYEMDASDAEHVSDVLIKVGQEYAISAEELMAAFQRGGAALHASGTDFEKSAALFAATNASLQNAETTGTMWKTVSARIRGATTELEEMGEETDGLAQGLSKYREEIIALSGVDIMKDENTYKDMYDIFVQLAEVWDNMEDVSQSRVAEILGGTRNTSGIMSTITNIKDAIGAYSSAMDSAGAATEANNLYMDTTKAKVGELKAAFQELSSDFISSNVTKGAVDALKGIVEAIDAVVNSVGSLGTILAGLGIVKIVKNVA
ncbi:phage tail tape measure protein [Ruminococcus sp. AF12-5]|nr:phage tail tape measure protein [Ruminococcus sp. AF12-5]